MVFAGVGRATIATRSPAEDGTPHSRNGLIRVVLAESRAMVRGALVALLDHQPDIEVVAELDRGTAVVSRAQHLQPDVVVLDGELSDIDGLAVARQLRQTCPETHVVIVSEQPTPRVLRHALEAQVRGFLAMDSPAEVLVDTVRRVMSGESVIDTALARRALAEPRGPLTAREQDVLQVAAEGASVPEIAARLSLSAGTVRNYLSAAIAKLGARNRLDAVRISRDQGWL
jgi:two-component system, NarL family, response regulator DesR